jgi:hypothetical protein
VATSRTLDDNLLQLHGKIIDEKEEILLAFELNLFSIGIITLIKW